MGDWPVNPSKVPPVRPHERAWHCVLDKDCGQLYLGLYLRSPFVSCIWERHRKHGQRCERLAFQLQYESSCEIIINFLQLESEARGCRIFLGLPSELGTLDTKLHTTPWQERMGLM